MRKVLIIGIGAGNPDYVTIQATNALNQVDVFFIPNKGMEKEALQRLRLEICERYIKDKAYRLAGFKTPERSKDPSNYKMNVQDWHSRIEQNYEKLLIEELGEGECGAFLVWGDPTLYDSTLRIIEKIQSKGDFALEYEVIPGISSVQALAAKHQIALNRIGESIHITTGRKLAEGFPNNADSVVVLLDGEQSFKNDREHGHRHLLGRLCRHGGRDSRVRAAIGCRARHRSYPRESETRKGLDHGRLSPSQIRREMR